MDELLPDFEVLVEMAFAAKDRSFSEICSHDYSPNI
jgi:hypothetical protein